MTLIAKTTNIPTNTGKVLSVHEGVTTDLTKIISNHGGSSVTVWEKIAFSGSKEFVYNGTNGTDGSVQEWEIPVTGTYQLEVYGAEGGYAQNHSRMGGKGGYAKGTVYLTAGTKIYVCVGGYPGVCRSGVDYLNKTYSGGYNGGGPKVTLEEFTSDGACGGGCTHIAKITNRGILKNYNSYRSEILIVAGGGGGGGKGLEQYDQNRSYGGHGGGTNAGWGNYIKNEDDDWDGYSTGDFIPGGTQTGCAQPDGWVLPAGTFGQGGGGTSWYQGSGGGGGWYGGCCGCPGDQLSVAGGGGSGYIGGVSNGSMSNGVRSGHGYAKITLL